MQDVLGEQLDAHRKAGRAAPNGADLKAAMTQVDPSIAQIFNRNEEPPAAHRPRRRPKKRF